MHDVIYNKDLPLLIKSEGDILIDTEYQNLLKMYTDRSKDPQNNTNGCAFVIPELKVSKGFKLQPYIGPFKK
jgi:hypothetical protein